MYIIKDNNDRYFMNWVGSAPVFNGDMSSAKILNETDANKVIKSMKNINKNVYEKVLCDDALMKSVERNNPEWYRQQIESLLSKYKKKSEDVYEDEPYSICDQIVDDLERMLD